MRRFLSILTALSLLLFCAFVFLWARTSYKIDMLASERFGRPWFLKSTSGSVELDLMSPAWLQLNPNRPPAPLSWSTMTADRFYSPWPLKPLPGVDHRGGGRTATGPNGVTVPLGATTYHAPYWIPTAAFAVLPAWWTWGRWREKRRRKVGHCQKCGYDLRATPDRCPECGTVPETAERPASA